MKPAPDMTGGRAVDEAPAPDSSSPAAPARQGETSIYAFLSNPTLVDFPGHMAAVFFTSGCNMRCGFCHNPDLLRTRQKGLTWERLGEVCTRFEAEWTTAAVLTGGEPTLAGDLGELITFFTERGWRFKLDTNGSRPEVLEAVLPLVDYVAMDVKASSARYRELTGFADAAKIAASIEILRAGQTDYELRTTLIEPFHDDEQLRDMGEMIRGARRYVLQAFIPRDEMPDPVFTTYPRTSPDRLREVEAMMSEYADEVLMRGD